MPLLVDQFLDRIDSIMPWDTAAVDATTKIKSSLSAKGTPIGNNDAAIAGNAVALNCVLVTNNTREFQRVENLKLEDWSV
jgi:tRNA(fMet)-specific endonuclease VapC